MVLSYHSYVIVSVFEIEMNAFRPILELHFDIVVAVVPHGHTRTRIIDATEFYIIIETR